MIDTPGPDQMPVPLTTDAEILAYLLQVGANIEVNLDELRQLEPDEQLRYFLSKQKHKDKPLLPELALPEIRQLLLMFKANSQAMQNYQPQVYPGKILFFRATEKDAINAKHPEHAWIDLVQEGL